MRKKREKEIFDLVHIPSENPYPIIRVNRNKILYIIDTDFDIIEVADGRHTGQSSELDRAVK